MTTPRMDLSAACVSDAQRAHLAKDQRKADRATCLLATPGSAGATGEYLRLWQGAGGRANDPRPGDVCFVSANGLRVGRQPPPLDLVRHAASLGCTFLTDGRVRRPEGGNPYNAGEQAVAELLRSLGFAEVEDPDGLVCLWRRPPLTVADVEAAGGYQVLYAEPALRYQNQARGSTDKHYHGLTIEQAMALPVARLVARDAVLFVWVPWPFVVERHQAHDLMVAWGFKPRTVGFVWVKKTANDLEHVGNGWWTRSNTEICLIGVRGDMRRAANSGPPASVRQLFLERVEARDLEPEAVEAKLGEHSAKPHVFRQRIEQLMGPGFAMLEMFARERHPRWDYHGDEVPGGSDVTLE